MTDDNEVDFNYLFKKLNVSSKAEELWTRRTSISFQNFYKAAHKQPISSFIRAMEERCRALEPIFSSFFKIDYEYIGYKPKLGSCMLFSKASGELDKFHITLPSKYEDEIYENDARTIIAHEIGHLYAAVQKMEDTYTKEQRQTHPIDCRNFLIDCLNSESRKKIGYNDDRASIIGAFILNRRSVFYKHKLEKNRSNFCKSFRGIVDSFEKLKQERKN